MTLPTASPGPPRPVIALLTDFGLDNHYVGVMKGVIAGACPDAVVIDITHGVPPQDVMTAAIELHAAIPYFPPQTIFVVVVDPGVGTARRALAARAQGQQFIGPDNGVFDLVLRRGEPLAAYELHPSGAFRPAVGRTFEGRDRFAPAAASLALGAPLADIGTPMTWRPTLVWPEPRRDEESVVGEVVHVDRFGNLVTNIERHFTEGVGEAADVWVGGEGPFQLVSTYGAGREGETVALFNSVDWLEVAVVRGHAASRLAAGRGRPVRVRGRP